MKGKVLFLIVLFFLLTSKGITERNIIATSKNPSVIQADINGNGILENVTIHDRKKSGSMYYTHVIIIEKEKELYRKEILSSGIWYAKICTLPYGTKKKTTRRDLLLLVDDGGLLYIISWERHGSGSRGKYRITDEKIQVFHPYD